MINVDFEESLVLCSLLAGIGGIMEVFGTAVLAYPAAKAQEGVHWSDCSLRMALVLNLLFQFLASVAGNILSTWFGPIAVSGPVFFAAQLVANLIIFWIVLGLEMFTKEMQIGTYVIVVAVALLLRVGPGTQEDQNFEELIMKPYALAWFIVCMVGMSVCSVFLLPNYDMKKQLPQWKVYAILLIVRSTAFAINLTTGRALILDANIVWRVASVVIKLASGGIYARAIVVQSTVVEQSKFVPLNACITLLVTAVTGILIWEDFKVVRDWVGYICVFFLFSLGCLLLLGDFQPLNEMDPAAFRPTYRLLRQTGRREMYANIRKYGDDTCSVSMALEEAGTMQPSASSPGGSAISPPPPIPGPQSFNEYQHRPSTAGCSTSEGRPKSRRESWAAIYNVRSTGRFHRASLIQEHGRGSVPALRMRQRDMDDLIQADMEMDARYPPIQNFHDDPRRHVSEGSKRIHPQKNTRGQAQHRLSAPSHVFSGFEIPEDIEEGSYEDDTSRSAARTATDDESSNPNLSNPSIPQDGSRLSQSRSQSGPITSSFMSINSSGNVSSNVDLPPFGRSLSASSSGSSKRERRGSR